MTEASQSPMFGVLPWLESAWQQLRRMQSNAALPHALLLQGANGIGKGQLARVLAHSLLCQQPGPQGACEQCKSCLLLAQGSHPDLVMLEPEEAGRVIKIDQIRALADFIGSSSQQGGYRVVVINPAEEMNISATNALLKGLEEPGEDTQFILVSSRPGRLAATIKSRCQTIKLDQPSVKIASKWLQEQRDVDNPELLLNLAAGAPLKSLELLDQQGIEQREVFLDVLKGIVSRRMILANAVTQWQKQDVMLYLDWLTLLAKDLLYKSSGVADEGLLNLDAINLINKAAARTTEPKIFAFIDKIQEHRQQILAKTNPVVNLLLEDILLSWTQLFQPYDIQNQNKIG